MVRSDQGNESPNTSFSITIMIEPKHRPQEPAGGTGKGGKTDYEGVTGMRKAPGTKKKKPKKK